MLPGLWRRQHLLFHGFSEEPRSNLAGSSGSESVTRQSPFKPSGGSRPAHSGRDSGPRGRFPRRHRFLPRGPLRGECHVMALCFMSKRDSERERERESAPEGHRLLQPHHEKDIPLLLLYSAHWKSWKLGPGNSGEGHERRRGPGARSEAACHKDVLWPHQTKGLSEL